MILIPNATRFQSPHLLSGGSVDRAILPEALPLRPTGVSRFGPGYGPENGAEGSRLIAIAERIHAVASDVDCGTVSDFLGQSFSIKGEESLVVL